MRRSWLSRQYGLVACIGSLVIGVTLPVILVAWFVVRRDASAYSNVSVQIEDVIALLLVATVFCGPLAVVYAASLYWVQRRSILRDPQRSLARLNQYGVIGGIVCAFANVPAWLVWVLLDDARHLDLWNLPRFIALFAVAGSSCGLWISWQAWRYHHPESRIFPRYSLKSLLIIIFLWGALMALFSPVADRIERAKGQDSGGT